MNFSKILLSLAAGAVVLAPTSALADHDHDRDDRYERRNDWRGDRHHDRRYDRREDGRYARNVPPPPPVDSRRHGRYELRTTSRWIEGRWVEDWKPGRCVEKQRRHRTVVKCKDGRYVRRWEPGYYQDVQEWVWVPHRTPRLRVSLGW